MIEWLNGRGRERSGASNAAADVALRAPVPEPPSLRDFFAFEGHVAAGARLRGGSVPEHWYKAPAFYFSNPASIVGPGAPVRRPEATKMLEFELEIAAATGGDKGGRLRAGDGRGNRRGRSDPRLHADERRGRPRRAGRRDEGRARPRQGEGLRHEPRPMAGHARRAAVRGRAPERRGARARE